MHVWRSIPAECCAEACRELRVTVSIVAAESGLDACACVRSDGLVRFKLMRVCTWPVASTSVGALIVLRSDSGVVVSTEDVSGCEDGGRLAMFGSTTVLRRSSSPQACRDRLRTLSTCSGTTRGTILEWVKRSADKPSVASWPDISSCRDALLRRNDRVGAAMSASSSSVVACVGDAGTGSSA